MFAIIGFSILALFLLFVVLVVAYGPTETEERQDAAAAPLDAAAAAVSATVVAQCTADGGGC